MSAEAIVHEGEFSAVGEDFKPIDVPKNGAIAWGSMADDAIVVMVNAAGEEKRRLLDMFREIEEAGKAEIERRLKERGATELPTPHLAECKLEEQFTAYLDDYEAAREAERLLRAAGKDEDAAKIIKHVPERTIVEKAHDELGNRNSISAIVKRYGDQPNGLGHALKKIQTRESLGFKLVWKQKKASS